MKYKVGDHVRIKSLDWYNKNKDEDGDVVLEVYMFNSQMSVFCGKVLTIDTVFDDETYFMEEDADGFVFTNKMIECKVEEEVSYDTESEWLKHEMSLPDGYIFKDENGNVINATMIVLEKKKKEYPKTYEECCKVLSLGEDGKLYTKGYKASLIQDFQKLLICRNAYWKLAGKEMGLGKSWEPDWNIRGYYAIARSYGNVVKTSNYNCDLTFVFPTEEMQDTFYENFKELIEECKELL